MRISDLKRRSRRENGSKSTVGLLLLVIIVLGSVALYYSPLLDGIRARNLNPAELYAKSSQSVVTITGVNSNSSVLGTGFVITFNHSYYIVTNYHMVNGYVNSTVTFSDGNAFPA
jgi:S1-C subfamily serine protease